MGVMDTIKYIFYFSKIFGILPFALEKSTGSFFFRECKWCYTYSAVFFAVMFSLHGFYCLWLIFCSKFDFFGTPQISVKALIVVTFVTSFLCYPLLCVIVLKEKSSFCFWLNKLKYMFSNLSEGDIKSIKRINVGLFASGILGLMATALLQFATVPDPKKNQPFSADVPFLGIFILDECVILIVHKMFFQFFLMLVNLLRSYFIKINEILNRNVNRGDSNHWIRYLRDLRLRQQQVSDFVNFLHKFFIPAVSLQLLWEFYGSLFNVMIGSRYGFSSAVLIVWTLYNLWDYFSVALFCHLTEKEAEQIVNCLHKVFTNYDNAELKEEVEIFCLQVQHEKVEFYAPGNIKMDLSLMYHVIGSLTSFAVILMQFQEPFHYNTCYKRVEINCSLILS